MQESGSASCRQHRLIWRSCINRLLVPVHGWFENRHAEDRKVLVRKYVKDCVHLPRKSSKNERMAHPSDEHFQIAESSFPFGSLFQLTSITDECRYCVPSAAGILYSNNVIKVV